VNDSASASASGTTPASAASAELCAVLVLDAAGKKRLGDIDIALSELTLKFAQNVVDATASFELLVRIGFALGEEVAMFTLPAGFREDHDPESAVRVARTEDLSEILTMDRRLFGSDRRRDFEFLRRFGKILTLQQGGSLQGYLAQMPTPGRTMLGPGGAGGPGAVGRGVGSGGSLGRRADRIRTRGRRPRSAVGGGPARGGSHSHRGDAGPAGRRAREDLE